MIRADFAYFKHDATANHVISNGGVGEYQIDNDSIVFAEDSGKIYTHGGVFGGSGNGTTYNAGEGIEIDSNTISVDEEWLDDKLDDIEGGITYKAGLYINIDSNNRISVDRNALNIPSEIILNPYTLPIASSDTLGGVTLGYQESNSSTNRKYAVRLENGRAYVEVPWKTNSTEDPENPDDPNTPQNPTTPQNAVITLEEYNERKRRFDNGDTTAFIKNVMYTVVNNLQEMKVVMWVLYTGTQLIITYPPQQPTIPEPSTKTTTEEEYNRLALNGISFTGEEGKIDFYATYVIYSNDNTNIIGYGITGVKVVLPTSIPVTGISSIKLTQQEYDELLEINQSTMYYVVSPVDRNTIIKIYYGSRLLGTFVDGNTLVSQSDITSIWKQKIQTAIDNKKLGLLLSDNDTVSLLAASVTFAGFQVTDDYDTWMGSIRNDIRDGLVESATFTAAIDEVTGQIAAALKASKDIKSLVGLNNKTIAAQVSTIIKREYAATYSDIPEDRRDGGYYSPAYDRISDESYNIHWASTAELEWRRQNNAIDPNTLYLEVSTTQEATNQNGAILNAYYGDINLGFYYYVSEITLSAQLINAIAEEFHFATQQDLNGISSNVDILSDRISNIVESANRITELTITDGNIWLGSKTFNSESGKYEREGDLHDINGLVGIAIDNKKSAIEAICSEFIVSGSAEIKGNITGGSISIGNKFNVTNKGVLTASEANITGTVTATSGTFSNCTIDNTCTINGTLNYDGIIGKVQTLTGAGSINKDTTYARINYSGSDIVYITLPKDISDGKTLYIYVPANVAATLRTLVGSAVINCWNYEGLNDMNLSVYKYYMHSVDAEYNTQFSYTANLNIQYPTVHQYIYDSTTSTWYEMSQFNLDEKRI